MTIQATKQADFPVYPAGMHLGRVKAVVMFTAKPNQFHPQPYPKLRWEWEIKLPGIKDPKPYSTFTSLSLHTNSYLPGLLKAIDVTPDEEGNFEEDLCKGKIAYLLVEEVMGKEGKLINQTTKYAAYTRGAPAPAIPATPPPAPVPAAPVAGTAVAVAEAPPAIEEDDPFGDDEGTVPF